MQSGRLTAGALRVWQRAMQLAAQDRTGPGQPTQPVQPTQSVQPVHLLWALVLDESRAASLLAAKGLTAEQLRTEVDFQPLDPDPAVAADSDRTSPGSAPPGETAAPSPADPAQHPVWQQVLQQAQSSTAHLDHRAEIGTEHLLAGLMLVPSELSDLFERYGFHSADEETGYHAAAEPSTPLPAEPMPTLSRESVTDLSAVWRMIDAAANRVREGVRVLEDYVRFGLDDPHLTRLLKEWRHEFSQLFTAEETRRLLLCRDTQADVGTTIHTRHETVRESLADVVRAAFKRIQEALRTMEESYKIVHPDLADLPGQLRYRMYTLERAVLLTELSLSRLAERPLYLLVTEELCHHGAGAAIRGALQGGVGIVQVREKKMPDRQLLAHARRVREWTREAGALLIMNDRPDLAMLCEADGVHVGQDELSVHDVRRIVGPDRLIGVSTHSIEQARAAVLDGADYIGVGPVFPSQTKSFREFAGLELVQQVAAEIRLPAYAIGGINETNLSSVLDAGLSRVAVSAAICSQADPAAAARALRSFLPGTA